MPDIEGEIQTWLDSVVLGLNLCPFAARPVKENLLRIYISKAINERELLQELQDELEFINQKSAEELETILLVIPVLLKNFTIYNQFLDNVDSLLQNNDWEGEYQIASFHPNYQFSGTTPDDAENLTNRSPYPIFHILRESSLETAIANYSEPGKIPENNIQTMNSLTLKEKQQYFPHLFSDIFINK